MGELQKRAAALRAAETGLSPELMRAIRERQELHDRRIGEFIGALASAGIPKSPIYAQKYRKGNPALGDQRQGRDLRYFDVHTGYIHLGEGWSVQDYDHNGGDLLDGIFVTTDGAYTRSAKLTQSPPSGNLRDIPQLPFYETSPNIVFDGPLTGITLAQHVQQGTDFALPENFDLLARALNRFGAA